MALPPFTESGVLPPGIHPATLDELEARFGSGSELRRVQVESLRWLVALARRAGVRRFVIDGSFVSDIEEPNDVDCVLLIDPVDAHDPSALTRSTTASPFSRFWLSSPWNSSS